MPKKILIVDDYEDIREVLCLIIGSFADVEFSQAGTYQEALLSIEQKGPFDLIICDFFLDNRTGLELFAELKKRNMKIPYFILSSGEPSRAEMAQSLGLGFLAKPFTESTVKAAVSPLLNDQ